MSEDPTRMGPVMLTHAFFIAAQLCAQGGRVRRALALRYDELDNDA